MLYPIIDIGSNTVKISVIDSEKIFNSHAVFFKAIPMAIKAKTENNVLPENSIDELCKVISEFCSISKRLTPVFPLAFATASLRGLKNSVEIAEKVFRKTNVKIDIVSGEEEALYSFAGALSNSNEKSGICVDMGGGSTEIISFIGNKIKGVVSLPYGCITETESFLSGNDFSRQECEEHIMGLLKNNAPENFGKFVYVCGGSAKALIKYKRKLNGKTGSTLSLYDLEIMYEHYFSCDNIEKEKFKKELMERYRLVPAALTSFLTILKFYGKDRIYVCKNGVREGYLIKYLEKNQKTLDF